MGGIEYIDDFFKNNLENTTVDVPADAWSKLYKQLHKPYSFRFKLFLFLFIGIYFSCLMGVFIYLDSITPNAKSIDTVVAMTHKETNGYLPSFKNPLFLEGTHPLISETASTDDLGVINVSTSQEVVKHQTNQRNATIMPSKAEQSSHIDSDESDGIDASHSTMSLATPAGNTYDKTTFIVPQNVLQPLSSKDLALTSSQYATKQLLAESQLGSDEKKACPFIAPNRAISMDVYFSNDKVFKQLISNQLEYTDNLNERLTTERVMHSFSGGIRVGVEMSAKMDIMSGVHYSQINEKFEYIDPESSQTRIITIKDYIYENGTIIDSIITQEEVLVPGTISMSINNIYRTVDIPLMMRYIAFDSRRLGVSLIGGSMFNILFKKKGMILADDYNMPIDINEPMANGDNRFKTNVNLSVYGAISLAYHINNKFDVLLEPNFRWHSKPFNTGTNPIDQKYTSIGINSGIRYNF